MNILITGATGFIGSNLVTYLLKQKHTMKGIYITEEGKKEIEAKIAELKDYSFATQDIHLEGNINGHLYCLNEILSSATILPVEEDWNDAIESFLSHCFPKIRFIDLTKWKRY